MKIKQEKTIVITMKEEEARELMQGLKNTSDTNTSDIVDNFIHELDMELLNF